MGIWTWGGSSKKAAHKDQRGGRGSIEGGQGPAGDGAPCLSGIDVGSRWAAVEADREGLSPAAGGTTPRAGARQGPGRGRGTIFALQISRGPGRGGEWSRVRSGYGQGGGRGVPRMGRPQRGCGRFADWQLG
jgi:hypothetical protein